MRPATAGWRVGKNSKNSGHSCVPLAISNVARFTSRGGILKAPCSAAAPFGAQVVERGDAQAAVAEQVGASTIVLAEEQVVVVGALEVGLAVLVDDPVARVRLAGALSGIASSGVPTTSSWTPGTEVPAVAVSIVTSVTQIVLMTPARRGR